VVASFLAENGIETNSSLRLRLMVVKLQEVSLNLY